MCHSARLPKPTKPLNSRALQALVFEVVEGRLRRRKVTLTDRTRARQGMQCLVSDQFYEGVNNDDGVTLRPNGSPEDVDLTHVVPWAV